MKKTLVIVDPQIDFMPGGALPVPEGDQIVPVINRIQKHFDLVIATQDWHPQNHVSFASNHKGLKEFDTIDLHGTKQTLWPDHCVQERPGAGFHPDLETGLVAAVFRKGMDQNVDSYSGFYDNDHKSTTGLAGYLREKKAGDLWFCGLAADICVYYSILDALKEGFRATLIEDAARPLDKKGFSAMKKELKAKGVRIVKSSQTGSSK